MLYSFIRLDEIQPVNKKLFITIFVNNQGIKYKTQTEHQYTKHVSLDNLDDLCTSCCKG